MQATTPQLEQTRFADLSLFHSAVNEVFAHQQTPVDPVKRQNFLAAAACVTKMAEQAQHVHANRAALAAPLLVTPPQPSSPAPAGVGPAATAKISLEPPVNNASPVTYCATLARNLALAKVLGKRDLAAKYEAELNQRTGVCDPHWVEVGIKYAEFLASRGAIPYRRWQSLSDFVIDGKLPANARVAIVGDWGTGQPVAKKVLQQIAAKKPDVVVHLGDVYYSGTAFEMQNYFYEIWCDILNLPDSKITTFTLAGNHDMFAGGGPYYNLIDNLGQPASYFCLRNDNWQFLAMDTGLHDAKPDGVTPTFLEDSEVQWLSDKVQNNGNRKTVLLSHHQLFSAFEGICGQSVNQHLNSQVQALLPRATVWLWGHEHNQVIYKKYLNVLGRCIGHGAFPIGCDEIPKNPKFSEIPVEDVRLSGSPILDHGYALMELNGPSASLSYFVSSDENRPVFTENF